MGATRSVSKGNAAPSIAAGTYTHAPSSFTLFWLAISLPLVVWDCGYVLLRPRTMLGGDLHWPIWSPYALYGEVDHVYGFKAFNANNGFTGAQGLLNALETALYLYYAYAYYQNAITVGGKKVIVGRKAAIIVLTAFSAAVMTLSKTVLYWLCEYFSGFDNIGHNSLPDLILLWIIPNGAWLVAPTYMIYELGNEIVNNLAYGASVKRD